MQIPKIIHQIFEGRNGDVPSEVLLTLSKTWKKQNSDWEYRFWDYKAIDRFLLDYFPHVLEKYHSFKYDVQRWDFIRYLILYQIGGVYVDLDYECLEPINDLLMNRTCCFGSEPLMHCEAFKMNFVVGNSFMATVSMHPFFKKIIECVSTIGVIEANKMKYVLETTGPHMLTKQYLKFNNNDNIYLIPAELVAPLNKAEVKQVMSGVKTEELNLKVEKAYAIHYFFGSWLNN